MNSTGNFGELEYMLLIDLKNGKKKDINVTERERNIKHVMTKLTNVQYDLPLFHKSIIRVLLCFVLYKYFNNIYYVHCYLSASLQKQ